MAETLAPGENSTLHDTLQPNAGLGLAIVRVTIGAMLVSVFFENLGKGLYSPANYAGLINGYIQKGTAPAAWKSIMAFTASHAAMAAPGQAVFEIGIGIILILGLFSRPAAFIAFLYLSSLWVSEWGIGWVWELLVPMIGALAVSIGRGGRTSGLDAWLAKRQPASFWW